MHLKTLKVPVFLIFIASLLLISCDDNDPRRIDYSTVPEPFSIEGAEKITTETGLEYYVIEEGICPSGDEDICTVNARDQIQIFYTKRLKDDPDRILSSSYANGVEIPVTTSVGSGRIITEEGFKQGVLGMKKGEKRVLILPPDLAYGNNPNSQYEQDTIWIDLELDEIIY
ncbi:FKBP-type peptidyl-prolyl cis-trans isomerase [Gracilimonas tropica]|uniref:FKBP-type peptidyl-prolyl cis-trans isomerase n=1 Tax=Gracilimonas tropica TaxID=454600 RepID=UPI00036C0D81|nr:FKBP-type peptidyl-prolyl cis-trans isomerase [Gracilimonas tropica]